MLPAHALAQVAIENARDAGVQRFAKSFLPKPTPQPGDAVKFSDGRVGRFLRVVSDTLGFVTLDGWTVLFPLDAIDVV